MYYTKCITQNVLCKMRNAYYKKNGFGLKSFEIMDASI